MTFQRDAMLVEICLLAVWLRRPHQPRVDFRLWFYGLAYRGAPPGYVDALCWDSRAIAPLFAQRPPESAVRLAF